MSFEIIKVEQRSPEWFELRKKHIGASEAGAILGVSPFKTSYDVWLEKTNLDLSEKYVSPAMQRGIDLEEKALECFNFMIGEEFKPIVVKNCEYPFMCASLDGMIFGKGNAELVEIKAPGFQDHLIAVNGKVPEKYYPQIQHQLAVTGFEFAYYFSFDGEDGVIVKVDRDQPYIDDLIAKEKEFWDCVQTLTEPKSKYIERNEKEWNQAVYDYKTWSESEEQARKGKERAKDTLIQLAGDQSNVRGSGITLQKLKRAGAIEFGNIPELKNVNLEPYRKKSVEYWRIDIT